MTGEKLAQMFGQNPVCQCGFQVESRLHLLLDCPIYKDLREYCIAKMTELILSKHNNQITEKMIHERIASTHLILDPSWFRMDIGSTGKGLPTAFSKDTADQLEKLGRTFCYQLYRRRFEILSEEDESEDSDEDCNDTYSIHDTSEDSSIDSEVSSEEDY